MGIQANLQESVSLKFHGDIMRQGSQQNKTVLITGGASGVGRASAERFINDGYSVVIADKDERLLEEVMKAFADQHHGKVEGAVCDVTKTANCRDAIGKTIKAFGRLDVLINSAGVIKKGPVEKVLETDWDFIIDVNLKGTFLMCHHAVPELKKTKGVILNIASDAGIFGFVDHAVYCASKGGALALTRAMAIEFAPDDIRVNAILPGAVDTPMLREGLSRGHAAGATIEERLAALGERTVMGRVGKPEEIARAILFLVDNQQSAFMTGQTLIVDGGATTRLSTE